MLKKYNNKCKLKMLMRFTGTVLECAKSARFFFLFFFGGVFKKFYQIYFLQI